MCIAPGYPAQQVHLPLCCKNTKRILIRSAIIQCSYSVEINGKITALKHVKEEHHVHIMAILLILRNR